MADRDFRVSDAERDRVARQLRDHCAVGRITIDELDERLEVAYRASTREELALATFNLPPGEDAPQSRASQSAGSSRPVSRRFTKNGI